jgi:hypothetical protein
MEKATYLSNSGDAPLSRAAGYSDKINTPTWQGKIDQEK